MLRIFLRLFLLAGSLVLPLVSYADSAKTISMDLSEAVAYALKHNANIQSAYLQRVLDKFNLDLAKENYRIQPSLNVDTVTTQLPGPFSRASDRQFGVTPGATWNTPYSTNFAFAWSNTLSDGSYGHAETFTINQPLLQGFGKQVAEAPLDNALDQEIIAKLNLRASLINTITTIINDFRTVQQTQINLENSKRSLLETTKHYAQDKFRVRAGQLARTELIQDQSQIAQLQVQIGSALNAVKDAQLNLSNDLGLGHDIHIQLPLTLSVPNVIPNRERSEQIVLAHNINYQQALLSLKLDQRALLIARDNARWNLALQATAARVSNAYTSSVSRTDSTQNVITDSQVSLNLTVPLGKKRLQNEQGIAQARIAIKNDEIKIAQLKVSLANQIDDGMERIKEDRLNISMSEQAVSLQDKTLEITRKKIKYGMSTNFELFSQQTTYFQLVQSLLQNRIQYLNDLASFDALLGTTLDTWHIDVRY